jgi:hypothetical protein
MAQADDDVLADLLPGIETASPAVQAVLDRLAGQDEPQDPPGHNPPPEIEVPEAYQVVVECRDETEQKRLYDRLTAEGFVCRVVSL